MDVAIGSPLAALERDFLSPARGDLDALAEALGCVGEQTGEEVWARACARGHLPSSWADDPLRRFRATAGQLHKTYAELRGERVRDPCARALFLLAAPPTAEEAVLFASDPSGLLEAEGLARRVVHALAAFGGPAPARVAWRIAGSAVDLPASKLEPRVKSLALIAAALDDPSTGPSTSPSTGISMPAAKPHPHRRFRPVVELVDLGARWRASARAGARVPDSSGEPGRATGRPFAQLEDPFKPWLALIGRGYLLRGVGDEAIELVAPFRRPVISSGVLRPTPARAPGVSPVWWPRYAALCQACAARDLSTIASLAAAPFGRLEPEQPRPEHYAVYGGAAALDALMEAGWSVELDARDRLGRTPLHLAAGLDPGGPRGIPGIPLAVPIGLSEGLSACQWLTARGADLAARDDLGDTPLHHAARYGRRRASSSLIEAGARIDAQDYRGRTSLHACLESNSYLEMARLLLAAGADADARDKFGWSALHLVAALVLDRRREGLGQALIRAGATPSRDLAGRSPADLAGLCQHHSSRRGPLDAKTRVAAGPGPLPAFVDDPLLEPLRLDLLGARRYDDPRANEAWAVFADWLLSMGDRRGELITAAMAYAATGRHKRRLELARALERLEAELVVERNAGIWAAAPFSIVDGRSIQPRFTHGFLTEARILTWDLPRSYQLQSEIVAGLGRAALDTLGRWAPLLVRLRVDAWDANQWTALLGSLDSAPAIPQVRHLTLGHLSNHCPGLGALARVFPRLDELTVIGQSKLWSARIDWPGPKLVRVRHGGTSEWSRGGGELELSSPTLERVDLGLPISARLTEAEVAGFTETLAGLAPSVTSLRLGPIADRFIDALAESSTLGRLREVELTYVRGQALERLLVHADAFRHLDHLRLDVPIRFIRGAARRQDRRWQDRFEQLRRQVPGVELV